MGVRAPVAAGPEQRRRRGRSLHAGRSEARTARRGARQPSARRAPGGRTRLRDDRDHGLRGADGRTPGRPGPRLQRSPAERRSTRSSATSSSQAAGYHETTAILDKIAAGQLVARREDMAANQLLSHVLEQLLARSKRQRDSEAAAMNMRLGGLRDGRAAGAQRRPRRRERSAHLAAAVDAGGTSCARNESPSSLLVVGIAVGLQPAWAQWVVNDPTTTARNAVTAVLKSSLAADAERASAIACGAWRARLSALTSLAAVRRRRGAALAHARLRIRRLSRMPAATHAALNYGDSTGAEYFRVARVRQAADAALLAQLPPGAQRRRDPALWRPWTPPTACSSPARTRRARFG